ncbi:hypothetical protein I553_9235 [Mycobacterium xenopi 4042]|uniref:Uncharacterized protein n=1 Tax=Mycobacterium xenopi 4042 TaxID=1299334 RepID=X8A8N3_MYCXE|nr:hypothetical protein I553_9235 [Mycobacterium xenopi 4042]
MWSMPAYAATETARIVGQLRHAVMITRRTTPRRRRHDHFCWTRAVLLLHPTRADVVGVGIVGVRQVLDVVGATVRAGDVSARGMRGGWAYATTGLTVVIHPTPAMAAR